MAASTVPTGDPTVSTVSIHDEEAVLRNLFTALSNLFVSFSMPGSGLIANIRSGNLRFKTSSAINDGIDKSVQSVVIPAEMCAGIDGLSPREAEILNWVAAGKSNPETAMILGISEATVGTHLKRLFTKLGVHDRVSAVLAGFKLGRLR